MDLSNNFKTFCENICLDNYDNMCDTAGEIAKKLNKCYYGLEQDTSSHLYVVGSVGRGTAIKGSSDLDILFDLPTTVFKKFDAYESNGQSALLQDVKKRMQERYPKTDISGDGQVVVIAFEKYTVELVPGFKQSDDSFKYPDTHNGGSWKRTNPLPEQRECQSCNDDSNGAYFDCCHMIRSWRNTQGIQLGGLLIDTLIYNHFLDNNNYEKSGFSDYYDMLLNIWKYLAGQDKNKVYWYAVGSNQLVTNSGSRVFIDDAKEAVDKISNASEKDKEAVLHALLGADFPINDNTASATSTRFSSAYSTEQFVEKLMPVDIRYGLVIDCWVKQDGFRDKLLSIILRENSVLRRMKKLVFYIKETNCPEPYDIYWKVRNVGKNAEERNCIRGQICKTNSKQKREHTDFYGPHFVECYLVKNGVCVARARINVPIGAG